MVQCKEKNEGDTDMCSICGIYAQGGVGIGGFATVREMSRAMAHRGPDGEGGFSGGNVGLHHNRLAVVDVTGIPQLETLISKLRSVKGVINVTRQSN